MKSAVPTEEFDRLNSEKPLTSADAKQIALSPVTMMSDVAPERGDHEKKINAA